MGLGSDSFEVVRANPVATERTVIVLFGGLAGNRSHRATRSYQPLITQASQIQDHHGRASAKNGRCPALPEPG